MADVRFLLVDERLAEGAGRWSTCSSVRRGSSGAGVLMPRGAQRALRSSLPSRRRDGVGGDRPDPANRTLRQLSGQAPAQVDRAALRLAEEQLEAIWPEIRAQGPERRPPEVPLHAPPMVAARAAPAMVNLDQTEPGRRTFRSPPFW